LLKCFNTVAKDTTIREPCSSDSAVLRMRTKLGDRQHTASLDLQFRTLFRDFMGTIHWTATYKRLLKSYFFFLSFFGMLIHHWQSGQSSFITGLADTIT